MEFCYIDFEVQWNMKMISGYYSLQNSGSFRALWRDNGGQLSLNKALFPGGSVSLGEVHLDSHEPMICRCEWSILSEKWFTLNKTLPTQKFIWRTTGLLLVTAVVQDLFFSWDSTQKLPKYHVLRNLGSSSKSLPHLMELFGSPQAP